VAADGRCLFRRQDVALEIGPGLNRLILVQDWLTDLESLVSIEN